MPHGYLALAAGTIFFVQVAAILEEWIFKQLPGFHYHWTVALHELLTFALLGYSCTGGGARPRSRVGPLLLHVGVGGSLAGGTGLGKVAFKYVNYATGTVLKSLKLLPVLLLSACWLGRRYTAAEVLAVCLMVSSAALFCLADVDAGSHGERAHSIHSLGISLSIGCVLSQAVQSNLQDKLLRDYNADVHEVMLYGNGLTTA